MVRSCLATCALALALFFGDAHAADASAEQQVLRGEYVLRAAGCAACHTDPTAEDFLAGGGAFDTPFGTFYSPNITSDPEQGIGRWSADALWAALTEGRGPDGRHYYPVFPYTSYTGMRRDDSNALHAYLSQVPASKACES